MHETLPGNILEKTDLIGEIMAHLLSGKNEVCKC